MLDKTYSPADVEARQYARWERANAFACGQRPGAPTYCIVIPPPNVTGSLHMGHALNNTLQDALVRYKRMRGFDVLWQPGTDHAGIATQMVVERQLALEQKNRRDLGRPAFLERVWQWKTESGGTISRQLRRLGASCDWSRERFTMDEGLSKAVLKVFVDLYRAGLIYKDKRLVNWDTRFESAISDLEVENREVDGHLWYFRYPIADTPDAFITIATTRPETMLADTGVAVHPDDERYRHLVGKHVVLPLTDGRRIPIVADAYADPEQGSGAVKITPAHDFNDFEVGVRHNLPRLNILDAKGVLNENAPAPYRGLDRFEARKKVVADLEALGLVEKIVPHRHMVPHGDRSGTVIEPWLTDQWYVDAKKLAVPAIEMVEQGRTRFVPKTWEKTYFEWMRNIQPWCVSRQLWWGHQIPAWYGPDGQVFVATSEAEAVQAARAAYGKDVTLARDEDVLDTWFSSALWPFSTLGWPEATPELKRYYPTSVLVTGFDIIFFWVARMMMMGLYFTGEIPFHDVYVHALVRDARGQKMSKSKGNIIDPLELIDKFGADALRFTLAAMAAQGRDVKLAESRVEGYRNFATKLWNAARFCEMNECRPVPGFDPAAVTTTLNRWIVGEAAAAIRAVADGLDGYRFNEAADAAYRFTWATFCDWYIEFAKPALTGGDAAIKAETRATAAWTLDVILHLLQPLMPFVTEEIFERFFAGDGRLLMLDPWPTAVAGWGDAAASAELDWVVRIVTEVRSVRSEMNVPAGAKVPLVLMGASAETAARLERHGDVIVRLARLDRVTLGGEVPKGSAQIVLDEATVVLPLAGIIDIPAERARLEREVKKLAGEIAGIDKKLANPAFVAKAPEEVVAEQHERRADAEAASRRLAQAVARLG